MRPRRPKQYCMQLRTTKQSPLLDLSGAVHIVFAASILGCQCDFIHYMTVKLPRRVAAIIPNKIYINTVKVKVPVLCSCTEFGQNLFVLKSWLDILRWVIDVSKLFCSSPFLAFTVRALTRRFIGEYDKTLGKLFVLTGRAVNWYVSCSVLNSKPNGPPSQSYQLIMISPCDDGSVKINTA